MFPTELTNLNQWLVWRFEPNGDKSHAKYRIMQMAHAATANKATRPTETPLQAMKKQNPP